MKWVSLLKVSALCFFGNGLFSVYLFCVINFLVLYCIAYAAGGPFSVAQKRGEKTLWPGLTRHACGRALNAGLFPVAKPNRFCPAVRLVGVNFHGYSPLKVQFLAA